MKIGTEKTYRITKEICNVCDGTIGDTGLCDWQCPMDGELARFRSKGKIKIQTFQRTDILISEEIK
jgi:hypothetical protein